jgi:hypothetical protein
MELLDSSTLRWRRGLLSICAVGFLLWAFASSLLIVDAWRGKAGIFSATSRVPFHDIVSDVTPGGAAAKAGIKVGDVVDLRSASAPDRWRFRTGHWNNGETSTYLVLRGAAGRLVTFRARRTIVFRPGLWDSYFGAWYVGEWYSFGAWYIGSLGALIFATIIAWRRPWLAEARILCMVLVGSVVDFCLDPSTFITPWPALDFGAAMVGSIAADLAIAFLIVYTLLFGRPISATRKAIASLAFVLIGFDCIYSIVAEVGEWSGAFDLMGGPFGTSANFWEQLALEILPLVAIATAIVAARGRERSLLVWTTAMPFLAYLSGIGNAVVDKVAAGAENQAFVYLPGYLGNGAQFLTPFAIGYALLHRRLLDIGFVLNQAAVFSGVSIIVVGLFMLGEWVLGTWFSKATHATSLEISAALALVLGFSVRAIHGQVEGVLDHVFFRKRHDDETAIRSFAEAASDAADANTLALRAKETLETHADAAFVTLAMDDGRGHYGDVSESDPAIVALRDRHKAIDLKTFSTQLRGEFAYPMIARGRLIGALVLGPKRSGESYAPDESNAIMQLAHEVAGALRILALEKVLQDHHLPA